MECSVIIPVYRTASPVLNRCIRSILDQIGRDDEIDIIVVDSSPDQVVINNNLIECSGLKVFHQKKRMFAGAARNFGVSKSDKNILIFLDSDCFWCEGWLSTAKRKIEEHPDWLAFNGQVLFENPLDCWPSALHFLEFHEFLASKPYHQRFLHSGNLLIKRAFFDQIGGFKNDWPACEDIGFVDFIGRSHADLNQRILFCPELAITHANHISTRAEVEEKIQFMGYWRGFYDRALPSNMQLSSRAWFFKNPLFLGVLFFLVAFWRSTALSSVMMFSALRNCKSVFWLAILWGKGVCRGFEDQKSGIRRDKNGEIDLGERFPIKALP